MGYGPSTCWELIENAANGNAELRDEFVARYGPVVRHYFAARWRETPWIVDAADAEAEVFLECLRPDGVLERADPSRSSGFRAYLHGVLRNVARRFEDARLSNREQQQATDFFQDPAKASDTSLSRVIDRAWARGVLDAAGARHRESAAREGDAALRRVELLRLRFEDDLPIREIAKRWNMDPATLHQEYRRARREFRRHLEAELSFQGESPDDIEGRWQEFLSLLQ